MNAGGYVPDFPLDEDGFCEACHGESVVYQRLDSRTETVERCDACRVFDTDESAAKAKAAADPLFSYTTYTDHTGTLRQLLIENVPD